MKVVPPRLLSFLLATILCTASLGPLSSAASAQTADSSVIASLGRQSSGADAVSLMGDRIDVVAAAHGKSSAELKRALKEDRSLKVDPKGHLFYEEAALPADLAAAAAEPVNPWAGALFPLDQTFSLHSKPGSKRVIYIDVDGHTLSNTAWNGGTVPNPLVCTPWDTDGNPSSFSDAERTKVQQVWQRVAEDYAPFDVDVTTQDPGAAAMTRDSLADEYYGVRVLITPMSSYFGGAGGRAFVGVFDSIGDAYKPALIFPEKLANGEKYVGEACSHEAGHTLGLLHDGTTSGAEYYQGHGTGETGWAPIMGSGYYKPVTHWSKGEYPLANNQEDDLAIINQNGAVYRADDMGGSSATSHMLAAGSTLSSQGVIERTGDVDVVSFAAGSGPATITVLPALLGGDLDVSLELRDESGALVASANPAETLGASLTANLSAGTYYLSVTGTGKGDPLSTGYSAYASLGAWRLSGAVADPGVVTPGPNTPPTAVIAQSGAGPAAPVSVTLDGSGSTDPDGSIASWAWELGDGGTASGSIVTHTYTQAGRYTVRLTVTDNQGAVATETYVVDVPVPAVPSMHVSSVTIAVTSTKSGKIARATVKVVDAQGAPVSAATVVGSWGGIMTGTGTGTTGSDGAAVITKSFKKSGTVTFVVSQVSKAGWAYDSASNTSANAAALRIGPRARALR